MPKYVLEISRVLEKRNKNDHETDYPFKTFKIIINIKFGHSHQFVITIFEAVIGWFTTFGLEPSVQFQIVE